MSETVAVAGVRQASLVQGAYAKPPSPASVGDK
jgi:hypothetical protein